MIEENIEQKSLDETYDRFMKSYHDDSSTKLKEIYYQDVSDDYVKDTLEEKTDRNNDIMNAEFMMSTREKFKTIYYQCKAEFAFNSKLHKHLKQTKFQCKTASSNLQISAAVSLKLLKSIVLIEIFMISFEILSKDRIVIQFTVESVAETDYAFQEWKYATFKASWYTKNSAKYDVYADIECTMSLSDREFIESITLNFATKIRKLTSLILIRDIENKIHNSDEYILMNDFIKETLLNNTSAIAFFQREVHLMNDLKMKMLIDIDILSSKQIQINLNDRILQIYSC